MNPSVVEDNEMLYRVIRRSNPDAFIDNKPTAALFMDVNGVSVDRDGGRDEKIITDTFRRRFNRNEDYIASVKITAGECRELNTYPIPVGKKPFHAEIHDSATVIPIGLLKALQLAERCVVV